MRHHNIAFPLVLAFAGGCAASALFLWFRPLRPPFRETAPPSTQTVPLQTPPGAETNTPASNEPKLAPIQLTPARLQSIGVTTAVVAFKQLHNEIRTTGNVQVDETRVSHVQLRFSGWVQQVFADATYQAIRKGDRLFTIYSPEITATEQEYVMARENRELLGKSTVPGVASGSSSLLNAAAERLRQSQIPDRVLAELEKGGSAQREIEIDSPASGFITERNAYPSVSAQPGTNLYTIADLSNVWVTGQVFQSDIERLKLGDAVEVTAGVSPGRRFSGHINFIYPQADEVTRTVKVRVEIPNPEFRLVPGMFVNLTLAAPLGRQLTIPASGVFHTGLRQIAFVDRGGGYFDPRYIETGTQAGNDVVVVSGLKAGERIVTSANFLIDSESQIQAAIGAFAPPPPGVGAAAAMNTPAQVEVEYSSMPSPPRMGSNVFRVKLAGADKVPVTGAQVTVTYFMAAMPAMGMAAMRTVATLTDKGNGVYEGSGQVQMGGSWQVTVVASKNGQTVAQKQFDVTAEAR